MLMIILSMYSLSRLSTATNYTFFYALKYISHMAPPPTDPITVMIEENVNATLERDGLKCSFKVLILALFYI